MNKLSKSYHRLNKNSLYKVVSKLLFYTILATAVMAIICLAVMLSNQAPLWVMVLVSLYIWRTK